MSKKFSVNLSTSMGLNNQVVSAINEESAVDKVVIPLKRTNSEIKINSIAVKEHNIQSNTSEVEETYFNQAY